MEQYHSARAGAARASQAGPDPTEPRRIEDVELPQTTDDAVANLMAGGLDPKWVRSFAIHTGPDGERLYVDKQTGQAYTELPKMHPDDGGDT